MLCCRNEGFRTVQRDPAGVSHHRVTVPKASQPHLQLRPCLLCKGDLTNAVNLHLALVLSFCSWLIQNVFWHYSCINAVIMTKLYLLLFILLLRIPCLTNVKIKELITRFGRYLELLGLPTSLFVGNSLSPMTHHIMGYRLQKVIRLPCSPGYKDWSRVASWPT